MQASPGAFRRIAVGIGGFLLLMVVGEAPIYGASRAVKWLFAGDLIARGTIFMGVLLLAVLAGLTVWRARRRHKLTPGQRSFIKRAGLSIVVMLVALVAVWLWSPDNWVVHSKLSHWPLLVTEWLITATIIGLGGYFAVGLPTIWLLEDGSRPEQELSPRDKWLQLTLDRGGDLLFVVVSLVGGSFPVAWWYASHRDPQARLRTFIAAWLLALLNSAVWVGLMESRLGWWIIGVLALPLVAWLPFVAAIYFKERRK